MLARQDASPDDIEMSSIFAALRRNFPKLLIWSAALGGLTYAGLLTVAPKYQSQAEITIVAKGAGSSFADQKNGGSPESLAIKMDKEAINTHVRALQSPDLIEKIAEEMNLKDKREFNSTLGAIDLFDKMSRLVGLGGPRQGESERDRVLNALFRNLEVYSAKESRFIGVRVSSIEPALAADLANRIAETYRNSLATAATQEVDDQQKVLQGKIDKLMPEVLSAETEVERFRGEINVFKGGANTGLNEQQLSELTAELTKAKAARSEVDARAKAAREMAKAGSADALPDVQKSPLIQNLTQQRVRIERQISELSATLLPGHPRMQQLNTELAGLKKQIAAEVSKVVESLEKEAKTAQSREDSIKRSLDEIKTRVVDKAPEEAKLRQLEATARSKRAELENLQAQLEANRKRLDTRAQPVEAQIITRASAASLPIFPKKGQNALLVSFATLLFGTFWTITRALFDGARGGSARNSPARAAPREVEEQREEPVLAAAPAPRAKAPESKPSGKAASAKAALIKTPAAAPAAQGEQETLSIEETAQKLTSVSSGSAGVRALVTGETASVDPVSEAVALAKSISSDDRHVILIDWSPAGKGIAATLGVSGTRGLTELLTGEASFEDVVDRVPESAVHVICCGSPLDEVADIDPDQLNLVLDALDEAYDFIIVVGAHDDARLLFEAIQGRFDAGIVVVDSKAATRALKDPPDTFLGFEVNDIEVIKLEKIPVFPAVPAQRIMRAVRRTGNEARPA